ncbi:MAG: bifunctional anthranilate synthase component II/anthranilate phosphoribosyltransferase [Candidatus Aminicenantes bacterium]|nr:bifunctional anthranilate synthase component II/anthranilate phosphoribosyltransferase [Candidatus Aminicenantes bacterium]
MILLIDNFDSFTYNIYQYVRKLGHEAEVRRNNDITIADIETLNPSHIIISPGPGNPSGAGISVEVVRTFAGKIPVLGVCLGHQSIGAAFGGVIVHAAELLHGKESEIYHDGQGIFSGMKNPFRAVRYHSLAIDRSSIPAELDVSAWTEDGEIMGVRHKLYSIDGVQFHPESIGTERGIEILANFLNPRPQPSRMQSAIRKVIRREDLEMGEAETVMEEIASGKATPAQIGSLLTALALKGESVSEISGFAHAMRRKATPIRKPEGRPLLDTCGTGGDASGSFNISTCAAFVAAGAGAAVAKHGNRSITSRCGSADLLEALGVNIAAPPEVMEKALREIGLAFLFAPKLHTSMKHAVPARVEMGIRTVFNILGPLANPAGADRQLIGVFSEDLLQKIAEALVRLGVNRAMVVHGSDGLDEITLTGPTQIVEVRENWIRRYAFHPGDLGFAVCKAGDLAGGNLKTNVEIALDILAGERGPKRDAVVINAAAAIYLSGLQPDLPAAAAAARQSIDSGAAQKKLDELIAATNH